MGTFAVCNPYIMFVCLAEHWELRQLICAGTYLMELIAFGMDVDGEDEWPPLLNYN